MANAYDQFDAPPPTNPYDQFAPDTGYSGSILPFSRDAQGNFGFDSNAGLLGTIKRAVMGPGDVYAGSIQPGDPEAINRAIEFATTFSPMSPATRAGEAVPGTIMTSAAPSAQTLKAAGSAGYDAARASDLTVPGQAIADMANQVQQTLMGEHGIIPKTAPKTYAILDELANPSVGAFGTYPGLEAARRGLSGIASEGGTEGLAAKKAIPQLDQFIDTVAPEAADARANYAAAQRSNDLTGALDRANTGIAEQAEARAHASHSGLNLDNNIRQRVASFLQNPQNLAGFSEPEIDALNAVIKGGPLQNAARYGGNLLGGGGGLGGLITGAIGGHLLGGGEGGEIGAMTGLAAGRSLKSLENYLALRRFNNVDEMVRMRSPLAQQMQMEGGLLSPALNRNSAVLRTLLPGLLAPQPSSQGGLLSQY